MNKQYRQGDVFFRQITELPKSLKVIKSLILVLGEATGHKHQLKDGQVFEDDKGLMFIKLSKATDLIHEEHGTIKLSKGMYAVIRQREYTPEEIRTVID